MTYYSFTERWVFFSVEGEVARVEDRYKGRGK